MHIEIGMFRVVFDSSLMDRLHLSKVWIMH